MGRKSDAPTRGLGFRFEEEWKVRLYARRDRTIEGADIELLGDFKSKADAMKFAKRFAHDAVPFFKVVEIYHYVPSKGDFDTDFFYDATSDDE